MIPDDVYKTIMDYVNEDVADEIRPAGWYTDPGPELARIAKARAWVEAQRKPREVGEE